MKLHHRMASSSTFLFALGATGLGLVACSASNGTAERGGGTGGSNGTTGGTATTTSGGTATGTSGGTTGTTSGGTSTSTSGGSTTTSGGTSTGTSGGSTGTAGASTAGATGTAGAAGAAAVTCSNTDKSILPVDSTGWVARECNNYGIQGAWYCYDDGITQAGCVKDMVPYTAGKGMCLKGRTLGKTTAGGDWGAGIGLSLNDSGMTATMASVKSAYNASMNGVKGFDITMTGTTGGLELRVGLPKVASPTGVSPFVTTSIDATKASRIMIADALVPSAWMDPNAGQMADPSSVYDLQVQIAGDSVAADFDFCITGVKPITDTTMTMTGTLATSGSALCDQYVRITVPNYVIQNNAYGGNTHCIQAKTDNATKAGFVLSNLVANKAAGGAPGSYPSIVYGWHVDGKFYGGYTSPKQLSAITSIPTNIGVTVPGGTSRFNTSYDNWINSSASAGSSTGTLEQMIWLNYRDTTPIGSKVTTVSLAGSSWDVWYGTHDGFATVSYVHVGNVTTMSFDINEFMKDTVQRGYAKASDYLLGIQSGFEIWEGSGTGFSVDTFDVAVK